MSESLEVESDFRMAAENFLSHLSVVMMKASRAITNAKGTKKTQEPMDISPSATPDADWPSMRTTLRASIGEILSSETFSLA